MDQAKYWNQDPTTMRFEAAAKGLIVVTLALLTGVLFSTPGGYGMGQGWAIAFPVVIGWILWDAVGLITRRTSMLNHSVLWPWLCACVGIAPGLFMLVLLVLTQQYNVGEPFLGALIWAAVWAVPAYGIHLAGKRLKALRDRRLQQLLFNASHAQEPAHGAS
ncbi:MAG: hypothetical protein JKY61_00600 [Planctomycetes bacterium]|nr:hypothetical protein [Planctomycetota bacterium]